MNKIISIKRENEYNVFKVFGRRIFKWKTAYSILKYAIEQQQFITYENNLLEYVKETYWANVFRDTIQDSEWLIKKSFSSGRWALSYVALYVIYRVLDDIKPKHILECGLGQSSKMLTQFAQCFNANLNIVEQNKEWIEFFCKHNNADKYIKHLELTEVYVEGFRTNTYKGFDTYLSDKKFDFVLIDGPTGSARFSRPQLIDITNNLAEQFIVVFDDVNRIGEQDTLALFRRSLHEKGIDFVENVYTSDRSTAIICSPQYRFLLTL